MSDQYGHLIDHVHLRLRELPASRRFYAAVVRSLGLDITWDGERPVEIRELFLSDDGPPTGPIHFAFRAADRDAVERFHWAGLASGGTANGPPGKRDYHPGYYSAYALDPDGCVKTLI